MHRSVLLSGLLALALPAQDPVPVEPEHHLVIVSVPDPGSLDRLLAMDLDLAACIGVEVVDGRIEVIATDGDIDRIRAGGFSYEVAIQHLEEHYRSRLASFASRNAAADSLTPALGQGSMGGHYTLAEMEAFLDTFAAQYPALCAQKVSIGQSIEGRDIWMVKISDNVGTDENEPEVYYDAVHHAREPLSMSTTLLFMDQLLSGYGTDPEATYIIDSRELYIVPCVNPDGYEYNRLTNPGGGGMWRKNRRDNGDGTFGVDPNRNYSTAWDNPGGGNSTTTSSSIYRGTAPFSEPETAAVENFVASRNFVQTFSVHCYTGILLRPWSFELSEPPNENEYDVVGEALTAENAMAQGSTADVLYVVAGGAIDHHQVAHGALSWSPELGRNYEGGFWPDPVNTVVIANRNTPMYRMLALTSGPFLQVEGVVVTELTGNGNGAVEPGETGQVVVTLRNSGVADTTGAANLTLSSSSPGVKELDATASVASVPAFGSGDNAGDALTFSVPAGYPDVVAHLQLTLDSEGYVRQETTEVVLAELRTAVDDDMEVDRGFERDLADTASTGGWERGVPQETLFRTEVMQPGLQHTPGGAFCWITQADPGTGVGSFDVDGGFTDLLSPVFDMRHFSYAELRFWRWYGESRHDDRFEMSVSDDGGATWTRLIEDPDNTEDWLEERHALAGPFTAQMQFRFRAQDLDASFVEAGIDDFSIVGVVPDGSITLMSSGALGTALRIGVTGAPNATSFLFVSTVLSATPTFPGISGILHLEPSSAIAVGPVPLGAGGYTPVEGLIPNRPELVGKDFHWQLVYFDGTEFSFSNLQTLTLK